MSFKRFYCVYKCISSFGSNEFYGQVSGRERGRERESAREFMGVCERGNVCLCFLEREKTFAAV